MRMCNVHKKESKSSRIFFSKMRKYSCFFSRNMVRLLGLMCDEARGCRRNAGNFRGVCPITGRKQDHTLHRAVHIKCSRTGIYYGSKPPFAVVVSAGFKKGTLETHGTVLSVSPH